MTQLPLPISPADVNAKIIDPTMALFPAKFDSVRARVLLLAIGLQESRFAHRRQVRGPARGLWQFERGGGVKGVLTHENSRSIAMRLCRRQAVPTGVPGALDAAYRALEHDDILACAFARLLLWTDSEPLPAVDDSTGAWDYYLRTWRPGKPHPSVWPEMHAQARAVFQGEPA